MIEIELLWVAKYSLAMVMSRNGVLSTHFAREATFVWNKVKNAFLWTKMNGKLFQLLPGP